MKLYYLTVFILFALSGINLSAQTDFYFKHITLNDGLSTNLVRSIEQDELGFIYFGTYGGLTKFDGSTYKTYQNVLEDETSIIDNNITSLAYDFSRNSLWVATYKGVSRLDSYAGVFSNYHIAPEYSANLLVKPSVFADSKSGVWVCGYKEKLYTYNEKKDIFLNIFDSIPGNPGDIYTICEDTSRGVLWLGASNGLYLFDLAKRRFEKCIITGENGKELIITCLTVDSDNKLWIGTEQRGDLYIYGDDTLIRFQHPDRTFSEYNTISSIIEMDKNTMMVGIRDMGVLIIDKLSKESLLLAPNIYNPNSISSDNPRVIFKDSDENIWIGTHNKGVNYLDNNRKFRLYDFNYDNDGLINNNVRAFYQDSEGDIWVGTKEGGGISRFNREKGTFKNYPAEQSREEWLNNDIVLSITELEPGKLLIGTYGDGIYLFDKSKKKFSHFSVSDGSNNNISNNYINALYKSGDDKIWIGTYDGVDIYDPITRTYNNLPEINYSRCFLDYGESVFIGTAQSGLYRYNKASGKINHVNLSEDNETDQFSESINGIKYDNDSSIWLASGSGLLRWNPITDDVINIRKEKGLINNHLYAIELDNSKNIWASTRNGLTKYASSTGTIVNYDRYDGLISGNFEPNASLKTRSDVFLFGGVGGFNLFFPDSISDELNFPKIILTNFLIDNKPVEIGQKGSPLSRDISITDNLTLKYSQSSFSFEFVGLNYSTPEKTRYRYKLEGFQKEWVENGRRRVVNFTSIPAGRYRFLVTASNGYGNWNPEEASVHIRVRPSFLLSPVAFIVYIALLILILIAFRNYTVNRTLQKNQLEFERREKENLVIEHDKRIRFFTNISHELRTPLTLITSPLERLITYDVADNKSKLLLQTMHRNGQRLLRLINQIIDFRLVEKNRLALKVAEGDLVAFISDICSSFEDLANAKGVELTFNYHINRPLMCWFDTGILEKVLFNLLDNAIKFTSRDGKITVGVSINEGLAIIRVTDTGIGIPADTIDRVFNRFFTTDYAVHKYSGSGIGLAFSKSLTEIHHGTIDVESEEGSGSCFTLTIPVKKLDYNLEDLVLDKQEQTEFPDSPEAYVGDEVNSDDQSKTEDVLMIVEDNVDLLNYLKGYFQYYNILACENGKEALEQCTRQMPDLILSDIMMPEMDGLELCRAIKTNFITSHIPVVLLTSRTSVDQKIEGFKYQADVYIEKPFNIEALAIQIKNLIDLRKKIKTNFSASGILSFVKDQSISIDHIFLDKVTEILDSNIYQGNLNVEFLSSELGMSRTQLFRKFKLLMDISPGTFIRNYRLEKATELIISKQYNVSEIAYMLGFSDDSHFISVFKKHFGYTPGQYSENLSKQLKKTE